MHERNVLAAGAKALALLLIVDCAAMELADVGDPGNPPGEFSLDKGWTYKIGEVAYPFRIAKEEVSNAEYCEFLNAKAAKDDPHGLYKKEMSSEKGGILREGAEGAWIYSPKPGWSSKPVNFVSRVDAARFCNWLSQGKGDAETEKGVYSLFARESGDGKAKDSIKGFRELSAIDAPRLYYLPDANEWYKAGYYQGGKSGAYRSCKGDKLQELLRPSHYGTSGQPDGVREWIEKRFWQSAILMGGCDESKMPDEFDARENAQMEEHLFNSQSGFRVAATPAIQICERVNGDDNFINSPDEKPSLKIRFDGDSCEVPFKISVKDYFGRTAWSFDGKIELKKGLNEIALEIPKQDGWHQIEALPDDPSYAGVPMKVHFAVCLQKMPPLSESGHFGIHADMERWEKRFTYEQTKRERFIALGASVIRRGSEEDAKAGFTVVPADALHFPNSYAKQENASPETAEKWERIGVNPIYAAFAEAVFQKVLKNKGVYKYWELGNEPQYWRILPEDYAQLAKYASIAIKAANPEAKIILGDMSIIHEPVLKMRAGDFCDVVSSHIYGFNGAGFWGVAGRMRALNGWMNACGAKGKPVWITETGMCNYSSTHLIPLKTLEDTWMAQALTIPKLLVSELAFGADKVVVYNFRDDPLDYLEGEFGMMDRKGFPKPAFMAFRACARLLYDAKPLCFPALPEEQRSRLAAFAFRDREGRDIVALWRHDAFTKGDFSKPLPRIIGPAENVELATGDAKVELFDAMGGGIQLAALNGKAIVPVDEYPVYVRGHFKLEGADVKTAFEIPPVKFKEAAVRLLPSPVNTPQANGLMSGFSIAVQPGTPLAAEARVYNLSAKEISGELSLNPHCGWRQFPWKVEPESTHVSIPPNGMASAVFKLEVPDAEWEKEDGQSIKLDASFVSSSGFECFDSTVLKKGPRQWDAASWQLWTKGCKKELSKDGGEMSVSWQHSRPAFVITQKLGPELAASLGDLKGKLAMEFRYDSANLKRVFLQANDANGETFQIPCETLKLENGSWSKVEFDLQTFSKAKASAWGGDKNKSLDFPLRLLGFVFEFDSSQKDCGKILLHPPEAHKTR